jgi:hypothetical protein
MQCLQCIQCNAIYFISSDCKLAPLVAVDRMRDRDTNYILPWMQTDQDGPFASIGCVGPLEMLADSPANEADEKELA